MGTYNNYYNIDGDDLMKALYPVGSVYLTTNKNFNPQTAWGGTWVEVGEGYALETTDANVSANRTISAGMPSITGNFTSKTNTAFIGSANGAFYTENTTADHHGYTGSGYKTRVIYFDASTYNSIYGNSDTVQPPAYKIYAWRRTA